jgi:hypothetical protein
MKKTIIFLCVISSVTLFAALSDPQQELLKAVRANDNHTVRSMINTMSSKAFDPNFVDEKGLTPLIEAVCNGNAEAVELLLQNKANPNHKFEGEEGESLLHTLIGTVYIKNHKGEDVNIQEFLRIAELLIMHGADVNAYYASREITPLDDALNCYAQLFKARKYFDPICQVLVKHRACPTPKMTDKLWNIASGDIRDVNAGEAFNVDLVEYLVSLGMKVPEHLCNNKFVQQAQNNLKRDPFQIKLPARDQLLKK